MKLRAAALHQTAPITRKKGALVTRDELVKIRATIPDIIAGRMNTCVAAQLCGLPYSTYTRHYRKICNELSIPTSLKAKTIQPTSSASVLLSFLPFAHTVALPPLPPPRLKHEITDINPEEPQEPQPAQEKQVNTLESQLSNLRSINPGSFRARPITKKIFYRVLDSRLFLAPIATNE